MRKLLFFLLASIMIVFGSCTQKMPDNFVFIKGGFFKNTKSNLYGKGVKISDFYIGKYEITQKEWIEVMGKNPSTFKGDNLPVETVSWYDCIEYCNKRSIKEGLKPFYNIDKNNKDPNNENEKDDLKWTVTVNTGAHGYRLPTEPEWEYASDGGRLSKSYTYSGSDVVDDVAWYWQNSGDKVLTGFWNNPEIIKNNDRTKPVGSKAHNELGLYDMSGNVREWCWDWYGQLLNNDSGSDRVWRGGGWLGIDFCCASTFRSHWGANEKGNDTGLRVCRSR